MELENYPGKSHMRYLSHLLLIAFALLVPYGDCVDCGERPGDEEIAIVKSRWKPCDTLLKGSLSGLAVDYLSYRDNPPGTPRGGHQRIGLTSCNIVNYGELAQVHMDLYYLLNIGDILPIRQGFYVYDRGEHGPVFRRTTMPVTGHDRPLDGSYFLPINIPEESIPDSYINHISIQDNHYQFTVASYNPDDKLIRLVAIMRSSNLSSWIRSGCRCNPPHEILSGDRIVAKSIEGPKSFVIRRIVAPSLSPRRLGWIELVPEILPPPPPDLPEDPPSPPEASVDDLEPEIMPPIHKGASLKVTPHFSNTTFFRWDLLIMGAMGIVAGFVAWRYASRKIT